MLNNNFPTVPRCLGPELMLMQCMPCSLTKLVSFISRACGNYLVKINVTRHDRILRNSQIILARSWWNDRI